MRSWENASSPVFLIFGVTHPTDKTMFLASSGNKKHKYLLCLYVALRGRVSGREEEIMGLLWYLQLMVVNLI